MKRCYHAIRNGLAAVVLAGSGTLSGCGTSTGSLPANQSAGAAFLRIVNGSPDIETVNPQAAPGSGACDFNSSNPSIGSFIAVSFNGSQAVASFPYGSSSGYVAVPSGTAAVTIQYPSSIPNGCPNLTYTTAALAAGTYHTLVILGQYTQKTLAFALFSDAASSAGAEFYNVAPSERSIDAGTFTPGQNTFSRVATVSAGTTAALPTASAPPGLGYYAGTGTSPIATIEPSSVDAFDTGNVIPFNSESRFSIFLMDPDTRNGVTVPKLTARFN